MLCLITSINCGIKHCNAQNLMDFCFIIYLHFCICVCNEQECVLGLSLLLLSVLFCPIWLHVLCGQCVCVCVYVLVSGGESEVLFCQC